MNSKCAIIMKKNHMKNMYNKKHSCFFTKINNSNSFHPFTSLVLDRKKNRLEALERCLKVLDISEVDSEFCKITFFGIWNKEFGMMLG